MDYKCFSVKLKSHLSQIGLYPSDYFEHSFRRGGASHALSSRVPADLVKIQGDLRSSAYQRYLKPSLKCRLQVGKMMAESLD